MIPALIALSTLIGQVPEGSVYRFGLVPALAVDASLFVTTGLIHLEARRYDALPPCTETAAGLELCDRAGVNPIDRWVTFESSAFADHLSTALLLALVAAPFASSAIDLGANAPPAWGDRVAEDSAVALEAAGLTVLITEVLKIGVRRPRPLTYNPTFSRDDRFDSDARLSFPSGHTSLAFQAASVLSVTLAERHGSTPAVWIGAGSAYLIASAVGYLRMAAGKHFVTDVLAGALIGTAAGIGVALAHLRSADAGAEVAADARAIQPLYGAWVGVW